MLFTIKGNVLAIEVAIKIQKWTIYEQQRPVSHSSTGSEIQDECSCQSLVFSESCFPLW